MARYLTRQKMEANQSFAQQLREVELGTTTAVLLQNGYKTIKQYRATIGDVPEAADLYRLMLHGKTPLRSIAEAETIIGEFIRTTMRQEPNQFGAFIQHG